MFFFFFNENHYSTYNVPPWHSTQLQIEFSRSLSATLKQPFRKQSHESCYRKNTWRKNDTPPWKSSTDRSVSSASWSDPSKMKDPCRARARATSAEQHKGTLTLSHDPNPLPAGSGDLLLLITSRPRWERPPTGRAFFFLSPALPLLWG